MKLRKLIAGALALAFLSVPAAAQVTPGTSPLSGPKGGTNNAFMQFTGPATSLKTYVLANANDTIGLLGQIQTWTGAQSYNDGKLILLGSALGTNVAAPSTPAAGKTSIWADSTDKRFHDKNDAGTIGTTVVASSCAANNWVNTLSAAGVLSCAQPAFSNLSGNINVNQMNSGTGAGPTTFWNGSSVWATALTSLTPGGGLVSSITAGCSQSAITTTGTLSKAECVNAQTGASYTFVDGDRAKLVTASNAGAQAYSLPQAGASSAFVAGWYVDLCNNSTNLAGIVTVTPTTSTIGGASSFKLQPAGSLQAMCVRIVSDGTNYQVVNNVTGDQLPGTSTNDNANAGNVGEYVESDIPSGSAISVTTSGVAQNLTSIPLTAGDWDVELIAQFVSAATTSATQYICSLSTTSATLDTTKGRLGSNSINATVNGGGTQTQVCPPVRFSLSATTTVFGVIRATFTASTMTAYGNLHARRAR